MFRNHCSFAFFFFLFRMVGEFFVFRCTTNAQPRSQQQREIRTHFAAKFHVTNGFLIAANRDTGSVARARVFSCVRVCVGVCTREGGGGALRRCRSNNVVRQSIAENQTRPRPQGIIYRESPYTHAAPLVPSGKSPWHHLTAITSLSCCCCCCCCRTLLLFRAELRAGRISSRRVRPNTRFTPYAAQNGKPAKWRSRNVLLSRSPCCSRALVFYRVFRTTRTNRFVFFRFEIEAQRVERRVLNSSTSVTVRGVSSLIADDRVIRGCGANRAERQIGLLGGRRFTYILLPLGFY